MADDKNIPHGADLSRWSLSAKILFALTLALLPIGLLAAVLSSNNVRTIRAEELALAENRFEALSDSVSAVFEEYDLVLRTLLLQSVDSAEARRACDTELTRTARASTGFMSILRINSSGQTLCASNGSPLVERRDIARILAQPRDGGGLESFVLFDEAKQNVIIAVRNDGAALDDVMVALLPRAALQRRLSRIHMPASGRFSVRISDTLLYGPRSQHIPALASLSAVRSRDPVTGRAMIVASGPTRIDGVQLRYLMPDRALGWRDALTLATPALMWLAALLIGWLSVRRLVVQPLRRMGTGLRRYARGDESVRLATLSGNTQEIAEFAAAFDRMANEATKSREEIESALAAQQRLMREVHHRVKNNLQIISSLLSIQSRDAKSPELARAYGAIQMRVNALALVHRWLFEDDMNRGVDFAALAHDLCASLENSIGSVERIEANISARIDRVYVGQDTAVPLSFLVTEIVASAGAVAAPSGHLELGLIVRQDNGKGFLSVTSDVFIGNDPLAPDNRSATARIAHGMARQMRGSLDFNGEEGCYRVHFPLSARAD